MKLLLKLGVFLAPLALSSLAPALAQSDADEFYRQWIDYRDGQISVAFDKTPVQFALHAFEARTGFQIVVPSTTEPQVVSLRLDRQPLEAPVSRPPLAHDNLRGAAYFDPSQTPGGP